MNFIHEVDYIFNFEVDGEMVSHKESHFVNDVDRRRYRWQEPINIGTPMPFNFKGTGNDYQEIEANLIGTKLLFTNPTNTLWHVEYELPDIDYVVIATVTKRVQWYPDGERVFYNFNIGNVNAYKKKLGGNA
ncbi:hypothetical protein [Oceanobacillus profundus]|uniref:Uncharacterized protein n=1 Tax=Oceanobacillus profundus TaxID=372463 RepID=A0A417YK26_9BACI|nr:hypothetical protein [Oceanobacillus profundus]RHW33513.1 hypothetical protein D1B32_05570 [Oceanobacillus profundus]